MEETDPWLTKGAEIRRCQHSSDGPQSGSEPLEAPQVDLSAPSEATTGYRANPHPCDKLSTTNGQRSAPSPWHDEHGTHSRKGPRTTSSKLPGSHATPTEAAHHDERNALQQKVPWPTSEDPDGNCCEPEAKSLEAPQAKAAVTIHATARDGQQDITRLLNRFTPQPLRRKQAGLYMTDTRRDGSASA